MNTFKFIVSKYLHENKRLKQDLVSKALYRHHLNAIPEINLQLGDNCGPAGYDSQLFLHSFKNWMLQSNVTSSSKKRSQQAITKEADLLSVPFCELALLFPFGVFRGIASLAEKSSKSKKRKRAGKKKETNEEYEETGTNEALQKRAKRGALNAVAKKRKLDDEPKNESSKNLKLIKAKYLLDKAKNFKIQSASYLGAGQSSNAPSTDRRANWSGEEDELILLVKVTSLYFFPKDKSIPFKLISDLMKQLAPTSCNQKRVSSFGRRIKILMRSGISQRFVLNKLELCRQDEQLAVKFTEAKSKLRRNIGDKEQVDLYLQFIKDVKESIEKRRDEVDSSGDAQNLNAKKIELPTSRKEFESLFKVRNSKEPMFGSKQCFYKQPSSDYEISLNTVHSAIHVSP